jgi:inorganic pyrophosphatase
MAPKSFDPWWELPSNADLDGAVPAIIDTPQGSHNKYKYDPELGLFKLEKVLTAGAYFPYNYGYVPGTMAGDGDPVDVLVLMDAPAFVGCLVESRLIGVIEARQTEPGAKKSVRNDRLLAVAVESLKHGAVTTIRELSPQLLEEIEPFFISYNAIAGKVFKPIGRSGPREAQRLLNAGRELFRQPNK